MHHNKKYIGLLGGTFDPIHNGHLHVAQSVLQKFNLDEIKLIPCAQTVHKAQPYFSAENRLRFVTLATEHLDKLSAEAIEIQRGGASYSIDTIKALKCQQPEAVFYFILGMDAFASFPAWQGSDEILQHCNLIVVKRPKAIDNLPEKSEILLAKHAASTRQAHQYNAGAIFCLDVNAIDISATEIRTNLQAGKDVSNTIPSTIYHVIQNERLYERN